MEDLATVLELVESPAGATRSRQTLLNSDGEDTEGRKWRASNEKAVAIKKAAITVDW